MTKVPSLPYTKIINALQRDRWAIIRQRGSHIRMQKQVDDKVLKITIPAHRPVKRSTLALILKQAGMDVDQFISLL